MGTHTLFGLMICAVLARRERLKRVAARLLPQRGLDGLGEKEGEGFHGVCVSERFIVFTSSTVKNVGVQVVFINRRIADYWIQVFACS